MGTPQIPSVDSDSKLFPTAVQQAHAAALIDKGTIEGAALHQRFAKNGLYENFSPDLFRRFQAAYANARAGARPCRVQVTGDSNTAGFWANVGNDYRRSFGARAMGLLDSSTFRSTWGIVWSRIGHGSGQPTGTYAAPDPRFTLGSGWANLADDGYGPGGAGAIQGIGPTSGSLSFTPYDVCDSFDVLFKQSSDASTAVQLSIRGESGSALVKDTFSTDGALTNPETGPSAYIVSATSAGTWAKSGGKLVYTRPSGASSTTTMLFAVDTGTTNYSYEITRGADVYERFIWRYVDTGNYWFLAQDGSGKYLIGRQISGTASVLQTTSVTAAQADRLRVDVRNGVFTIYVNGSTLLVYDGDTSAYASSTMVGYGVSGAGAKTGSLDDLVVNNFATTTQSLAGSDGVRVVSVSASTLAQRTLDITASATGSAVVLGIRAYRSGVPAMEWTIAGYDGGRAENYTAARTGPWSSQPLLLTTANPDIVIINLLINAHNASQSIAGYTAATAALIDQYKAANVDVILIASGAGGNGNANTWVDYLNALRSLAQDKGCGLINMQARWLPYALSSLDPYKLWNDPDHPSASGYWDLGQTLADGLRLALGRSA